MNYQFSNLLGAPYRGGNILLRGDDLLAPVGNRVSQVSLTQSTSQTLPFENMKQVRTLCMSPDGFLLLSIDEDGRAILINKPRRVLLHHFSFKGPVAAAKFSPDGKYLAVAVGRLMQVWRAPGLQKAMSPMQLHRTYGQCHSDVTDLDWSPDSRFIAVASKDITARIFSLNHIPGFQPPTLTGHGESLVGVFFAGSKMAQDGGSETPLLFSLSRDGALLAWKCTLNASAAALAAASSEDSEAAEALAGSSEEEEPAAAGPSSSSEEEEAAPEAGTSAPAGGAAGSAKRGSRILTHPTSKRHKNAAGKGVSALGRMDGAEAPDEDVQAGRRMRRLERHAKRVRSAAKRTAAAASSKALQPTFPDLGAAKDWCVASRNYLNRHGASVSAHAWHPELGVLVIGLSSGIFEIYQMPEFTSLQTLSIGRERITSLAFNDSGDWIAVGCAKLGQLLVWEWRSETYVLKQQGHYAEIAAAAFSPDGALVATGADDRKVKVFNLSTGFCFVTFADHSAPVTAVAFLPSGHAVVSASLDGTVRAYDLVRYRNFRTLAAPSAVQFGSLAVDPGGEVVCAGTLDTFQIYVWSLKTSRLLDVLSGHEGPVSCLAFSPTTSELASASWDHTVRLWDVFSGKGSTEVLDHRHDVLALAYRPDGKELACATLDGQIYFWQPREAELLGTIEGRRDIKGGRLVGDRRSAGNLASGACFTSLVYSADGATLLGGGASKYVVMYDVADRLMLRRFQLSHNRGLDGVLDQLNSRNLTDAGPLALIDHDERDRDVELLPPTMDLAAHAADMPGNTAQAAKRPMLRSRCVVLSPTGRCWAAATPEGLMLYSMDEDIMFDPASLTESITTKECVSLLSRGHFSRALTVALHLNNRALLHRVVMSTPPPLVAAIARGLPYTHVPSLLATLAAALVSEPHLEFLLSWVQSLARQHGRRLAAAATPSSRLMPVVRELQTVLNRTHSQLAGLCEANLYTLEYLCSSGASAAAAAMPAAAAAKEEEAPFQVYEKPAADYEVWQRQRRKAGQERQEQRHAQDGEKNK